MVANTLSQAEASNPTFNSTVQTFFIEGMFSGCPVPMQETVYWRARVPWQEGLPAKDRNIT